MAATFDGVDDKYQLAGESTLRYEWSNSWSGHCWIKVGSGADNCIFGKAQNTPANKGWAFNSNDVGPGTLKIALDLANNAGTAQAYKIASGGLASGAIAGLQPGIWVPVGFTYSGNGHPTGITLYCNGQAMTADSTIDTLGGASILVDGTPMTIGGFQTEFWPGTVCGIVVVPALLTATEMLWLADVRNMYTNPSDFLTSGVPDVWLPLRYDGSSVDLNDYSGNGHNASVGGGAPAAAVDPTIVFDTFSQQSFTSSASWTHTPNNHVEAVVVMIAQNIASTDLISAVTYGGAPMTRVPTNGFAQDTTGEPGAAYVYTLLGSVPQGAQTVAVTVSSGTDAKQVWIQTLNSITPRTLITASGKLEGDAANPSVTLGTGTGWNGFIANVIFSGQNAPSAVTPGTGFLGLAGGRDFGSQSARAEVRNTSGASAASGWTSTIEDVAMSTLALEARPPRNPSIQAAR